MNRNTERISRPPIFVPNGNEAELQRTQLWPWIVAGCPLSRFQGVAVIKMVLDLVYFMV
jgi:hypothetical protein